MGEDFKVIVLDIRSCNWPLQARIYFPHKLTMSSTFGAHFEGDTMEHSVSNIWALYGLALMHHFISRMTTPFLPMEPRRFWVNWGYALIGMLRCSKFFVHSRHFPLNDFPFLLHVRALDDLSRLLSLALSWGSTFIIDWRVWWWQHRLRNAVLVRVYEVIEAEHTRLF